jgi:S-adenosylmethionine synthetase
MVNVVIERLPKAKEKVEIVELKGKGHPDTLSDTLCNLVSNELSQYYMKHFGAILHHNVDKGVIVAGKSEPKFGGGEIIEPMKIVICGRATTHVGNVRVPVKEIVQDTVKGYMKQFPHAEFVIIQEIKEGASNLKEVFKRKVQVANDTSCGVSYYPYSDTEKLVLDVRDILESKDFRNKFKAVGDDIKIMAVREDKKITLTLAIAFIDRYLKTMGEYLDMKNDINYYIHKRTKAKVFINTLDSFESESSVYLTVSGLSAEMGDDGQVGRGNRYNDLITPGKPMGIEATAGKNISHPGKLYQVMAFNIAKSLVEKAGLGEAHVKLVTQIGRPLDEPLVVSVLASGNIDLRRVKTVVDDNFRNMGKVQEDLIFG